MASRAESAFSSRTTQSGTPAPTNFQPGGTPESLSQSSLIPDEDLIEAENQVKQPPKNTTVVKEYQPFQELLKTPITIEYGEKLTEKYTIHLELLRCYSHKMIQRFAKAEARRLAYLDSASLRKELKALLPPQTDANTFSDEDASAMVQKAMPLILQCLKRYPLIDHQVGVRKHLEKVTVELLQDKNAWKVPPSSGGIKKKEKEYLASDVEARLRLLNHESVKVVVEALFLMLWNIKRYETKAATCEAVKAAAQGRIILPDFDGDTVGSLVHWLYLKNLHFENAEHLYKIYDLAEKLGVTDLAETCMSKLSTATFDAIQRTKAEGTSLMALLNNHQTPNDVSAHEAPDALVNVVPTVFKFVLQEKKPPTVLQKLVIEAIADNADLELIDSFEGLMSLDLYRQLTRALVTRFSHRAKHEADMEEQNQLRYPVNDLGDGMVNSEVPNQEKDEGRPYSEITPEPVAVDASYDDVGIIWIEDRRPSESGGLSKDMDCQPSVVAE